MVAAPAEPLILVPGLLCTAALYAPQLAAFGRNRHVTVADHARHDRVAAIATAILSTAPPRFALAGLSMGGYVVLEMWRQAPDRITRLALLDTSPHPDTPERSADRRRLMEIARAEGVTKVQKLLLPRLVHPDRLADEPLCDAVVKMAADTGLDAFLRQQEAIIARPDSRPTLPTITCPTLVLCGADDALTPPAIAREIAAGIPGSTLEIIPDCGHLSTMERPRRSMPRSHAGWRRDRFHSLRGRRFTASSTFELRRAATDSRARNRSAAARRCGTAPPAAVDTCSGTAPPAAGNGRTVSAASPSA